MSFHTLDFYSSLINRMVSLIAQLVKNPPATQETPVWFLGWEDPLEKGKATYSSNLAWRIPRSVLSMGLQRVRYDWVTFTLYTTHTMLHKQYLLSELFVLENSQSTRKPLHPPPLKTKSRLKREGAYVYLWLLYGSSVQFSCSVMSDSLRPHGLRHARPPCPSPTPRVHSNSCPLSWWCHPAISSSVVPFSSCPQSLQHQGLFQWLSSLPQVAQGLEFQLQHQSFQWIFRTNL